VSDLESLDGVMESDLGAGFSLMVGSLLLLLSFVIICFSILG
jgi:hypothetical protein